MRQKGALLAALVFASVTLVSAQSGRLATVNVPFEFTAGNTVLPAGDYVVERDNTNLKISTSNGAGLLVPIVTRLAQLEKSPKSFALVFDKVGERRFLSEVWTPRQDGYLVRRGSEKHTHDVLRSAE